jgi:hypothetical protein
MTYPNHFFGIFLARVFFAASLTGPLICTADDPLDMLDGPTLGDHVSAAANQLAEYKKQKVAVNDLYSSARQDFWRTYPDRPGHKEAKEKFARLLFEKDLYFASIIGQASLPIDNLSGGRLDGGIHISAEPYFDEWSAKYTEELEKAAGVRSRAKQSFSELFRDLNAMASESAQKTAFSNSFHVYQAYKLARDYAEFKKAGKVYPGSDDPKKYFIHMMVIWQEWYRFGERLDLEPWSAADKMYNEAVQAFGSDHIHNHSRLVMSIPAKANGWIAGETIEKYRSQIGPVVWKNDSIRPERLMSRFFGGNSKAYALEVIRDPGSPPLLDPNTIEKYKNDLTPWRKRRVCYDAFVAKYGEEKVLTLIEKLRAADRGAANYPETIGCFSKLHGRDKSYGSLKPHYFEMDCFEFLISNGANAEHLVNSQGESAEAAVSTPGPDTAVRRAPARQRVVAPGTQNSEPPSATPRNAVPAIQHRGKSVQPPPNQISVEKVHSGENAPVNTVTNVIPSTQDLQTTTTNQNIQLSTVVSNVAPQVIDRAVKKGLDRLFKK